MIGALNVTFRWKASTTQYPNVELQAFSEAHLDWLPSLAGGDGVLYSLPQAHVQNCVTLFRLNRAAIDVEIEFAELCNRHQAVGVCNGQFVRYSLLQPPLRWPSHRDLSDFLDLGWTEADIAGVKKLSNPTDKIHHRLRAAAGRLISTPPFTSARDTLRQIWRQQPAERRMGFPILRSTHCSLRPETLELDAAPESLIAFVKQFDRFCDDWQLMGMATWDLPLVRGPNLVPGLAPADAVRRGELTISTPWHFTILIEDGLGRVLESEHRRQAAERGIDDEDSWETYARLLDIYHWGNVFFGRYRSEHRVRGFVTQLESVLGDIMGLGRERVQKPRKWLRQLQSGKLASLRGRR